MTSSCYSSTIKRNQGQKQNMRGDVTMKCTECAYCWKGENEEYACCHYEGLFEAPCEIEEDHDEYDEWKKEIEK